MGLRFRRRFNILPGVSVNLSRSGVSISVGMKGAHVTIGHGKVRETVGIPGTGLSYTESQSLETRQEARSEEQQQTVPDALPKGSAWRGWPWLLALALIALAVYLAWPR